MVAVLRSFLTTLLPTILCLAALGNASLSIHPTRSHSSLAKARSNNHPQDLCKKSLGLTGSAKPHDTFWMEAIKHQGKAPYHPNAQTYKVFRNVKDYGAFGDGVHDDTEAINAAITDGGRCTDAETCGSTTISPAVVYFPAGTYLVTKSIMTYYYTQLIGNPKKPPTILAAESFTDFSVIEANPNWMYINQVNFFRSVRNLVIDTRRIPPEVPAIAMHWQVSQATSLMNIVIHMSDAANTEHQGIWMENGSGGYMGDVVINGGKYGFWGGNQQFTVKNFTINNAKTAIMTIWNWGWTWQRLTIKNCEVGFDVNIGAVGAEAIIDAEVINTPTFIRVSAPSEGTLATSLVIQNTKLKNVGAAIATQDGTVVLAGGTRTIKAWGQGNIYAGSNPNGTFVQADLKIDRPANSLLDGDGKLVARTHPQYETFTVDDFVSVKDYGAKGDGVTDDTKAIQQVLNKFAGCKIIFFDAGHYVVTDTINIPAGTRMIGEGWTVIAGKGPKFQKKDKPCVVFRVGKPGDVGIMEISDIIFSTIGPAPGAIVVEWNIREPNGQKAGAGMWDTHIRTGGAAGTQLSQAQCPKDGSGGYDNCFAAFLNLHITKSATAYVEAAWVWLADHDLDGDSQINVYSGRGILSESQGPVWLVGTGSEHHVIYQYRLVGAKDHYLGLIQTESPYYQPVPSPPTPFKLSPAYKDPQIYKEDAPSSWALSIADSKDIFIYGAGLYSFFKNYTQDCIDPRNCQSQIADIDSKSKVQIFSLSTVAAAKMISVDGKGVVDQADNINGFESTVTFWKSKK